MFIFNNAVLLENEKHSNKILTDLRFLDTMKLLSHCCFKITKIMTTFDLDNIMKHIITREHSDYNLASQVILSVERNYMIHYKFPVSVTIELLIVNETIGSLFSYIYLRGFVNEFLSNR